LAEHIVGNARIGRGAILYAFEDFIAEAQELAAGDPAEVQFPAQLRTTTWRGPTATA
jgi:hypothetical protein